MKHFKSIIIQSFIFALFVSATALAVWEESTLRHFFNRGESPRLLSINFGVDTHDAKRVFDFTIQADLNSFEALQNHISQRGFSFRKSEVLSFLDVEVPFLEVERAHRLLDILNTFEAIQPQQVLTQMRNSLDDLSTNFENRQQQLAEIEATPGNFRILPLSNTRWWWQTKEVFPPSVCILVTDDKKRECKYEYPKVPLRLRPLPGLPRPDGDYSKTGAMLGEVD